MWLSHSFYLLFNWLTISWVTINCPSEQVKTLVSQEDILAGEPASIKVIPRIDQWHILQLDVDCGDSGSYGGKYGFVF